MSDSKDLILSENEMAGFFHNGGNWKGFKFRNKSFDSLFASNAYISGRLKFITAITNKTGSTDGLIDVYCDTGISNGITTRGSKGGTAYGGTGRFYFRDDGSTTETNWYMTRAGSDLNGLYIKGNGGVVIPSTTQSDSINSGALIVKGGIGVTKTIHCDSINVKNGISAANGKFTGIITASDKIKFIDSTKTPIIKDAAGKYWRIKISVTGAITADSTGQN